MTQQQQEEAARIMSDFKANLKHVIALKYRNYYKTRPLSILCKQSGKAAGPAGKNVFDVDWIGLNDACEEMMTDINFLAKRRKNLMDSLRPSFGKIAGVIAYRLAKNHIIHLHGGCIACPDKRECAAHKLNAEFALRCAWEYIAVRYERVPEEIRRELFYTFSNRHTNQETLGLVFDTIYSCYGSTAKKQSASS